MPIRCNSAADKVHSKMFFYRASAWIPTQYSKLSPDGDYARIQWADEGADALVETEAGAFYRVVDTRVSEGTHPAVQLRLSPGDDSNTPGAKWINERSVLMHNDYVRVVFGFFEHEHRSVSGTRVAMPMGAIEEDRQMSRIRANLWHAEHDSSQGMEVLMSVEQFLERFPPTPVESSMPWTLDDGRKDGSGPDESDDSDVPWDDMQSKYPSLVRLMEVSFWDEDEIGRHLSLGQLRTLLQNIDNDGDSRKPLPKGPDVRRAASFLEQQLANYPEELGVAIDKLRHSVHLMGSEQFAGDAALAGAMIAAEVASILGQPGPLSGAPQPEERETPTARKARKRSAAARSARDEDADDDEDDDDTSGSDSYSDDEPPGAPRKVQRQAAAGASAGAPPAKKRVHWPDSSGGSLSMASGDEEDAGSTNDEQAQQAQDPGAAAKRALRAITPQCMQPLDAAELFFRGPAILGLAGVESLQGIDLDMLPKEDVLGYRIRYGLALLRLQRAIPDAFVPTTRPQNPGELVVLREAVFAAATALASGGGAGASGGGSNPFASGHNVDGNGKKAEGLPRAERRFAVPMSVASRLQTQAGRVEQLMAADSISDGVRMAPEGLREALQQAYLSNGKVHAPGELKTKAHLLPAVVSKREELELLVADQLRQAAQGDATQRWSLPRDTAHELSVSIIEGSATIDNFNKASRAMRGAAASPIDSIEALQQGWALSRRGFEALGAEVLGSNGISGLQKVSDAVDPTARSAGLSVADVKTWLARLFDSWNEQCSTFRSMGGQPPSFTTAVAGSADFMTFAQFKAAAASAVQAELQQGGGGGRKRRADEEPTEAAQRKKEKRQRQKEKKKAGKQPNAGGGGGGGGGGDDDNDRDDY